MIGDLVKNRFLAFLLIPMVILPLAVGWSLLTSSTESQPQVRAEPVGVIRAVDGDTLVVERNGVEERVRLLGIDAPEVERNGNPGEACADEATALMRKLTSQAKVEVVRDPSQPDQDRYGRTLAYVEAAGHDVSAELLRSGMAEVYEAAPNIARYADYRALEESAPEPPCLSG